MMCRFLLIDRKGLAKDCRYNGTKYSHIIWCGENQGQFSLQLNKNVG